MGQISIVLSKKKIEYDFAEALMLHEISELPSIGVDGRMMKPEGWISTLENLLECYKDLDDLPEINNKKKNRLNNTKQRLEYILQEFKTHYDDWVIQRDKREGTVTIKPIDVSRMCKQYFFDHVDYTLMMSATILSKDHFCKWHGLNPDDVEYIYQKSPFPKERRPIILETIGSMAYKNIENTKPKTIHPMRRIMEQYSDDKGIIHTHSHSLALYLTNNLNSQRTITYTSEPGTKHRDKLSREDIIEEFRESEEPLVLIAPSVSEGVDLPDDLCRFQILYKVPYPSLHEKQIKFRMKRDPDWYAFKTVSSILQSYGRGMRSKDDYCTTFITDADIHSVLNDGWRRCAKFIPDYFEEAIGLEEVKNLDKNTLDGF
jgi:Rad3-related DNA helicase